MASAWGLTLKPLCERDLFCMKLKNIVFLSISPFATPVACSTTTNTVIALSNTAWLSS